MSVPVWVLSVDLQTKTATFQSGMAEAARSARGAFTDIKSGSTEMGTHLSGNMFASRHAIMAVSESLGVQMPRAITALLVHIGPLGAALEAAFPFAAIALGAVLIIEKLAEMKEAGIKLTEDQVRFGTTIQTVFNSLDQKFIQAQIRSDELKNDHLAALQHQLQLINMQSMDELVQEFSKLAKEADTVFAGLEAHWYSFGEGARGAKAAMEAFQVTYAALAAKGDKKGASDLLAGTLESAEKTLEKLKEISKTAEVMRALASVPLIGAIAGAASASEDHGKAQEIAAQEKLVELLKAQGTVQDKVSRNANQDGANATAATAKAGQALSAEAARQAAEHTQRMGEIGIAAEHAQAQASLDIKEASVLERLAMDTHLADEEMAVQLRGNAQLQDALNRGGNDFNNQLKGLRDKAQEIEAQHAATVTDLAAKASVAQYRQDLQNLQESEREKIDATDRGSLERLAAIDAAIKEEMSRGLQLTNFYRELEQQRVETQRQADTEAGKLAAEAGKEAAENTRKTGDIALAAQREHAQLMSTLGRVSAQEQLSQDLAFANAEFDLKRRVMEQEEAALDKGAKDHANKLREMQDTEKQLVQQHEDAVAAIRAKAQAKQMTDERSAMASMENTFASGFLQVLSGHQSFATMMDRSAQQLTGNLITAAINSANHLDDDKLKQAESAARAGFAWGAKYGGPAAPVLAPVMAATFFAGVMAFEAGGIVPGSGRGDIVPAMLSPGEGIIPGGMMDNLNKMARSGGMGGGNHYHANVKPTYHIQAIDSNGVETMLNKHHDTLMRHVESTLRKLNH